MKKVFLRDELSLSKEIIADLSPEQLLEIEGGVQDNFTGGSGFSCLADSCIVTEVEAQD